MSKDDFDLDPIDYYELVERDPSKLRFPEPGENPQFDKVVEASKRLVELLRNDKLRDVDKKMRPMRKAELMEYAHELAVENQMLWLELGNPGDGKLRTHVMREQNVVINEQKGMIRAQKTKLGKGAEAVNKANREFWDAWRARYRELRNEGVGIMKARRNVQKEIIAGGGRKYDLEGALKKQLKE